MRIIASKCSLDLGSSSVPERTLLKHLPMVRCLARKIHQRLPRYVDIEDLYSAGLVGLMEAYVKFNPSKDVRFVTYAQFRIRGAIIDSLRSLDWAPRELRHKGRAVQEAIQTLTARSGHTPSDELVAKEMNTSLSSYHKLISDLHSLEIGTLYRKRDDESDDDELVHIPGRREDDPLFRFMQGETVRRLTEAIHDLPERERLVLTLYYSEELTRNEIAVALGIDIVRVSQIRASAVLHLRSALSDLSASKERNPIRMPSESTKIPVRASLQKSAA